MVMRIDNVERYINSAILFIVLISALVFSFFLSLFSIIDSSTSALINTIAGLLFSIPVSLLWLEFNVPILRITKDSETGKEIAFDKLCPTYTQIQPLRITVENVGRNAAKECKGYFITNKLRKRVIWTRNTERPNATINVNDKEQLDLFGFQLRSGSDALIAIPLENEWNSNLDDILIEPLEICTVLITAENAKPVQKTFTINVTDKKIQFLE